MSSGVNANAVKTALDVVFSAAYDQDMGPMMARATDSLIFNQSTADRSAVIMEVFKGVGLWEEVAESASLPEDTSIIGDNIVFQMKNFKKKVTVPVEYLEDDLHSTVNRMVEDMGRKARISQDSLAMSLFRDAFTGASFTTADRQPLCSDAHTNLAGGTVDNYITAALSETSLNTALVSLAEQVDQSNEIIGMPAQTLVVPPALFKTACEIVDSELRSGTADNDGNVYSSKYNLYIKQSPYLGAAAGGSDTAWFLLSPNHSIYRWVRTPLETSIVDHIYSDNDEYVYKGRYREEVGAITYEGVVGSDGTA